MKASRGALAIAVAESGNEKIGVCATTYAAQVSCPTYCAFFNGGGCYAENGRIYTSSTGPLNENARAAGASALDVAHAEAEAIRLLPVLKCWDRPLRLHTVGDCASDEAAQIVSAAAAGYRERGGGPVWTYTHAWRIVDRSSWGEVSVLASCETAEQVELARARGYAPSIVLERFDVPRRYLAGTSSQVPVLPCPAQTHEGVTCASCRLCMKDDALLTRDYAIGFAVHGTAFTVRQAKAALRNPSNERRRLTLRELIPTYLEDHPRASNHQIAAALGYEQSSVHEMRGKLLREGVLS